MALDCPGRPVSTSAGPLAGSRIRVRLSWRVWPPKVIGRFTTYTSSLSFIRDLLKRSSCEYEREDSHGYPRSSILDLQLTMPQHGMRTVGLFQARALLVRERDIECRDRL